MDIALLWLAVGLLLLGMVTGVSRYSGTKSLEYRLARVERKLDFVLEHLDLTEPTGELAVEVGKLLSEGKKIVAIKRYREATGAGLADAKDAVERIGRGATP